MFFEIFKENMGTRRFGRAVQLSHLCVLRDRFVQHLPQFYRILNLRGIDDPSFITLGATLLAKGKPLYSCYVNGPQDELLGVRQHRPRGSKES